MRKIIPAKGKLLVFFLSFFLLCSFSTAALSDTGSKLAFKDLFEFDRDNDVSIKLLRSVFGQFNGILRRKTQTKELPTIYNDLFRTFNQIMMALATLVLTYTFITGIINTANEGKFMGEKQHSIWTPIRSVAGFALIVPTSSGYSLIQVIMMWVVVQGIGAAHQIWSTAIDGIVRYGVVQQVALKPDRGQYSTPLQSLLADTYCFYKTQSRLLGDAIPAKMDMNKIYYYLPAQHREGYSFNCCCLKADCMCVNNDHRGIIDQCPSNYLYYGCGTFSYKISPDSIIDRGTFQEIATLFLDSGYEAMTNEDYTTLVDTVPIKILNPSPVKVTANTIDVVIEDKQIKAAKAKAEERHVIKKQYGWADAGAFFFEFAEDNNDLAAMGDWDKLGLDVQPCASNSQAGGQPNDKSACFIGKNNLSQYYRIPPVVSDLESIKPPPGKEGLTSISFKNLQDVSLTEVIDTVTGVVARLYCGLLFGTFSPQDIYSTDESGRPLQPAGSDKMLHPLIWIQAIGHRFVIVAELVIGIGGLVTFILSAISGICSSVAPGAVMFSAVLRLILSPTFMVLGMIFGIGLTMEVYIPLIPYIIFSFGVIGWLIAVLETVLAAPLVALGITYPEGKEMLSRADPAVMLLTNIFIRPTFMIFGLVSGLFISQVAVNFLNHSFAAVTAISNSSSGIGGFEILLIIAIYMAFVIAILNKSFNLITQIPDQVLKWIGNTQNFGESSHDLEAVKQGASAAAGASGEIYKTGAAKEQQQAKDFEDKTKQKLEGQNQAYDSKMKKDGVTNADGSPVAPKSDKGKAEAKGAAAAEKDKAKISQQKAAAAKGGVSAKGVEKPGTSASPVASGSAASGASGGAAPSASDKKAMDEHKKSEGKEKPGETGKEAAASKEKKSEEAGAAGKEAPTKPSGAKESESGGVKTAGAAEGAKPSASASAGSEKGTQDSKPTTSPAGEKEATVSAQPSATEKAQEESKKGDTEKEEIDTSSGTPKEEEKQEGTSDASTTQQSDNAAETTEEDKATAALADQEEKAGETGEQASSPGSTMTSPTAAEAKTPSAPGASGSGVGEGGKSPLATPSSPTAPKSDAQPGSSAQGGTGARAGGGAAASGSQAGQPSGAKPESSKAGEAASTAAGSKVGGSTERSPAETSSASSPTGSPGGSPAQLNIPTEGKGAQPATTSSAGKKDAATGTSTAAGQGSRPSGAGGSGSTSTGGAGGTSLPPSATRPSTPDRVNGPGASTTQTSGGTPGAGSGAGTSSSASAPGSSPISKSPAAAAPSSGGKTETAAAKIAPAAAIPTGGSTTASTSGAGNVSAISSPGSGTGRGDKAGAIAPPAVPGVPASAAPNGTANAATSAPTTSKSSGPGGGSSAVPASGPRSEDSTVAPPAALQPNNAFGTGITTAPAMSSDSSSLQQSADDISPPQMGTESTVDNSVSISPADTEESPSSENTFSAPVGDTAIGSAGVSAESPLTAPSGNDGQPTGSGAPDNQMIPDMTTGGEISPQPPAAPTAPVSTPGSDDVPPSDINNANSSPSGSEPRESEVNAVIPPAPNSTDVSPPTAPPVAEAPMNDVSSNPPLAAPTTNNQEETRTDTLAQAAATPEPVAAPAPETITTPTSVPEPAASTSEPVAASTSAPAPEPMAAPEPAAAPISAPAPEPTSIPNPTPALRPAPASPAPSPTIASGGPARSSSKPAPAARKGTKPPNAPNPPPKEK